MLRALLTLLILSWMFGEAARAEKLGTEQLVAFASEANPQLEKGIEDSFSEKDLEGGVAWSGHLHDFFFATRSATRPVLFIDDQPGPAMAKIEGSQLCYAAAKIEKLGDLH